MRIVNLRKINQIVFRVLLCISMVSFWNCTSKKYGRVKLFEIVDAEQSGIRFQNKLTETVERNGLLYEYFYNGGGVGVGDFNNDDFSDVYLINNLESNRLYLNQKNLTFRDVTDVSNVAGTGFPTGVTTVDINGDGNLDIYVCKAGKYGNPDSRRNELYLNMGMDASGIPIFEEVANEYGLDIPAYSTQAAFFDYDLDNDLDVFIINHDGTVYTDDLIPRYREISGKYNGDRLYENVNGKFHEVTLEAGIINNKLGFGLGVSIGDLNNDGWPDIYVSSDFSDKDHLYINNQNGTFTEKINELTNHMSYFSMGNDMADFNNDGLVDIITVDMVSEDNYGIKTSMSGMNPERFNDLVEMGLGFQYMYNTLQLNVGVLNNNPYFSEIAQLSGISSTDWSWAPLFFDMDNDGFKDLFISNGIKGDFRNNDFVEYQKKRQEELMMSGSIDRAAYINEILSRMPERKKANYFYKNNGDQTFKKQNGDWFVDIETATNGASYADLDNDGDLDIVVNNTDDPSYIIRNYAMEKKLGNYLKLNLVGSGLNTKGIGSRVTISNDSSMQMLENYPTRGFQSSTDGVLHFGLGKERIVDKLKIVWPDGKEQLLRNVKANQKITLKYQDAKYFSKKELEQTSQTIFKDITTTSGLKHTHIENEFNDFQRESLLPHKMSRFGPAIAVADVNSDGLQDVFIGGAHGFTGSMYLQTDSGRFKPTQLSLFEDERSYEDVAAVFFDADGDLDHDLYVVSGGNEHTVGSSNYLDRIYENVNGILQKTNALPNLKVSGSCVKPFDFDSDGDLDLFIGGRQVPGHYPLPSDSYILQNNSNASKIQFIDVTDQIAPDLKAIGMVTDAQWVDVDNDNFTDLVLAGEWMPITILRNEQGHFTKWTDQAGLDQDVGWWFNIESADLDKDGDQDFIAGNLGLNYKYKASNDNPFEIFAEDFDNSGDLDIVLGFKNEGHSYPLRGRECSSAEMPFIKSKFPTYEAFAKAELHEIYSTNKLESSTKYSATNFSTSYFENNGSGNFKLKKLPVEAQYSSVNSMIINDFNNDGIVDLLMAGNLYSSEVETPRNDASYGCFLIGDGSGNFEAISTLVSGLHIEGEVKEIIQITILNKPHIIVAKNNDNLNIFRITSANQ